MRFAASVAGLAACLLAGVPVSAPAAPASSALRQWDSGLSKIGAVVQPGQGPWRLVAASLETDSYDPLCGGELFAAGAPITSGGGSIVFRFLDETGAPLCPPAARGKVLATDGGAASLDGCEQTAAGAIQRYSMAGAGFAVCAGEHGGLAATVDESVNDGLAADAVVGLGLPNGRAVNVVLTWQRNPPAGARAAVGFCNISITTACPLPDGTVGQQYDVTLGSTGGGGLGGGIGGGIGGVVFQIPPPGTLPPGLALQSLLGSSKITGNPTVAGTYNFTILAADLSDPTCVDQKPCSITVTGGTGGTTGGGAIPPQYTIPGNNAATYASAGGGGGNRGASRGGASSACAAGATPFSGIPAALGLAAAFALLAGARRLRPAGR